MNHAHLDFALITLMSAWHAWPYPVICTVIPCSQFQFLLAVLPWTTTFVLSLFAESWPRLWSLCLLLSWAACLSQICSHSPHLGSSGKLDFPLQCGFISLSAMSSVSLGLSLKYMKLRSSTEQVASSCLHAAAQRRPHLFQTNIYIMYSMDLV